MLCRRGHAVDTASNMALGLRLASEGEHDLLISDIELPDGSGLELMDAIRSRKPIPGIALSGFGSTGDVEQSLAAGFVVHLTKPVDFRRLEKVIYDLHVQRTQIRHSKPVSRFPESVVHDLAQDS